MTVINHSFKIGPSPREEDDWELRADRYQLEDFPVDAARHPLRCGLELHVECPEDRPVRDLIDHWVESVYPTFVLPLTSLQPGETRGMVGCGSCDLIRWPEDSSAEDFDFALQGQSMAAAGLLSALQSCFGDLESFFDGLDELDNFDILKAPEIALFDDVGFRQGQTDATSQAQACVEFMQVMLERVHIVFIPEAFLSAQWLAHLLQHCEGSRVVARHFLWAGEPSALVDGAGSHL